MQPVDADQILDTALALAAKQSWERVRLCEVARSLGCSLGAIQAHFNQKEALVEAWFDRADAAMLAAADAPGLRVLPRVERLEQLLMAWLAFLEPHRHTTRQMILGRLEPGHLHIQLADLLRISRTVQWWREAAGCRGHHLQRALQESLCTAIYLDTFGGWLTLTHRDSAATRARLHRLLSNARPLL